MTDDAEWRDRQAIADELHAYCRLVDANRTDEATDLFTRDCTWRYRRGDDAVQTGRDTLAAHMARSMVGMRATSHHLTNLEIALTGRSSATVDSYVSAIHFYDDHRPEFQIWARYHDQFVETPEGWRIADRRVTVAGTLNGTGMADWEPVERVAG